MYILINFLIFVITLFLYIHIYFHIKCSNYLEIYEIENISRQNIEEIYNLKQPFLFNYSDNNIDFIETINIDYLKKNYGNFDIKIYNKNDTNIAIPINLLTSCDLFIKDSSNNYYSEHNNEFLEETTLLKYFADSDIFLRPINTISKNYDILMGSVGSYSNLKYSVNFINILYVNDGEIDIVLTSPNNNKYLHTKDINENFEYVSNIDYYNPEEKYKKDFNKAKFMHLNLKKGSFLRIPAYWFYSIKIVTNDTLVSLFKYKTLMNTLATLPDFLKKILHDNNIKRNFLKVIEAK